MICTAHLFLSNIPSSIPIVSIRDHITKYINPPFSFAGITGTDQLDDSKHTYGCIVTLQSSSPSTSPEISCDTIVIDNQCIPITYYSKPEPFRLQDNTLVVTGLYYSSADSVITFFSKFGRISFFTKINDGRQCLLFTLFCFISFFIEHFRDPLLFFSKQCTSSTARDRTNQCFSKSYSPSTYF